MTENAAGLSRSQSRSLQEVARQALARQGPGAHPRPQTLTAYDAGELDAAAAEEVQEHLAICVHCARLLLDLPAFLAPPETPGMPVPGAGPAAAADLAAAALDAANRTAQAAAVERSWGEIRKHLPAAPSPAAMPLARLRRGTLGGAGRRPAAWRPLQLLAAALVLALLAVPLWLAARRLLPRAPVLPAQAELLRAIETRRGAQGAAEPAAPAAVVHASAASASLVLVLGADRPDLRFRVEIQSEDAAAQPAARTRGRDGAPHAARSPRLPPLAIDSHTLLLVLTERELAPGSYRIRVLDPDHPSEEPLGEFPIQVVDP